MFVEFDDGTADSTTTAALRYQRAPTEGEALLI